MKPHENVVEIAGNEIVAAAARQEDALRKASGYVLSRVRINCASCIWLGGQTCNLYGFQVDPIEGCCNDWDNPEALNWREERT